MSDVVAAALIAGTIGLLGSAITLMVTRRNSIDQRQQHREDTERTDRQVRQDHCAQLAWQIGRLHKYDALGFPPTREDWADWLDHYAFTAGVVMIHGTSEVVAGVQAFTAALEDAAPDLRLATESARGDEWRAAYGPYKKRLEVARQDLVDRMRRDAYPSVQEARRRADAM